MILVLIFAGLALTALVVLHRAARGHVASVQSLEELEACALPVDLDAFRNLVDPAEEDYLRTHLSPAEFRRIQRRRLRAALTYVRRASHNAAVLVRLGEAARESSDPEVTRAGQDLVNSALRMRLYTTQVQARLFLLILVPGAPLSLTSVADRYQALRERVGRLCRLQQPAYAGRISAAL